MLPAMSASRCLKPIKPLVESGVVILHTFSFTDPLKYQANVFSPNSFPDFRRTFGLTGSFRAALKQRVDKRRDCGAFRQND